MSVIMTDTCTPATPSEERRLDEDDAMDEPSEPMQKWSYTERVPDGIRIRSYVHAAVHD